MKKINNTIWYSLISLCLLLGFFFWLYHQGKSSPHIQRETVQVAVSLTEDPAKPPAIAANKLPEFVYTLSERKFDSLMNATSDKLHDFVTANIAHTAYAQEKLSSDITLSPDKRQLRIHPQDIQNFKPGKYRLSLALRTLEGEVHVEQDFTWGVIAVNTNKSIYKPGDVALIGMGVLDNDGETQCMTGKKSAKVWLTVTAPDGKTKDYSTENGSIKDSGKCAAVSVTNTADFNAIYLVSGPGIYRMKVIAQIQDGEKRDIEDYFKVEANPSFDVERKSFPTRIYPRAEYAVHFTVTPQNDYSGTVEEFLPSNFYVSKISSAGRDEFNEDFRKITWNVQLKKGQTQTFSYTIYFPQVSPEFYLLGPITIGDFKEARQWQIASDSINSTTGLVTYEDNNGSNTFSRIWTGTAWNPPAPTPGTNIDPNGGGSDDFPDDSRWFVEKSSPKTGEKLVSAYDNCGAPVSDQCLWMYRWTGTAWAEEDFVFGVATPDTDTRIMDIAYEENSGDALFVYGDSTNQIKYRRKASGSSTWSSAANAGTFSNARPRWVKAKSQFRSDDILVAFLNTNNRIGALIWDGTSNAFGNQFDDDDSPAQTETATNAEEPFDVAWETQSGTPMIFWGDNANDIRYREFTGGAWSGESTLYTAPTNNIQWLTANADPIRTSNYIAIATQEANSPPTCGYGMWTGSAGETMVRDVTCRANNVGRLNTVQFENDTGDAIWAYVTSTTGTQLSWRRWTTGDTAPGSSTTESGATTGNIESIQLHTDLNTTSMIALYAADSNDADTDPDLYHREWDGDGDTWSALGTSLYGRIQGAGENAEAYGFGFDRNLETMAAYTWFTAANNVAPGAALASQDTPYTLTQPNQQFRLRLLLYYPDSLAVSGRNYRLQFVDPGTGTCDEPTGGTPSTWTDVGAPGSGSAISYYNNSTPADGDNISNATGDPTYGGFTNVNQDYEEGNTTLYFTNSVSAMSGDQNGKWDFSLVDNTTFDATPSTFCFRVVRDSNSLVLQIGTYPKITTAALNDVLIQGDTLLQGGTLLQ